MTAEWEKVRDGRYALTDGRYWAQWLYRDHTGDCWVLWQAQEEPPAVKRSGCVVAFCDTLDECKALASQRQTQGLSGPPVRIAR